MSNDVHQRVHFHLKPAIEKKYTMAFGAFNQGASQHIHSKSTTTPPLFKSDPFRNALLGSFGGGNKSHRLVGVRPKPETQRGRMRLARPDLSAENTSAAHFHLARRKLGRTDPRRKRSHALGSWSGGAELGRSGGREVGRSGGREVECLRSFLFLKD